MVDSSPKGMHGYLPTNVNSEGKLIINSGRRHPTKSDKAKLVDIFPTILDLMGLPIPPSNEGKSLVVNDRS